MFSWTSSILVIGTICLSLVNSFQKQQSQAATGKAFEESRSRSEKVCNLYCLNHPAFRTLFISILSSFINIAFAFSHRNAHLSVTCSCFYNGFYYARIVKVNRRRTE